MGMSIWHLLLILVVVFILFGAGKLPRVMGDIGKGIRAMRDGLKNETEEASSSSPKKIVDGSSVSSKTSDRDHTSV